MVTMENTHNGDCNEPRTDLQVSFERFKALTAGTLPATPDIFWVRVDLNAFVRDGLMNESEVGYELAKYAALRGLEGHFVPLPLPPSSTL